MKGTASKPYLVHGQHHRLMEFVLAINGKPESLRRLSDAFVVHALSKTSGAYRQVAMAAVRDATEVHGCGVLKFVVDLEENESSLRIGYIENPDPLALAMGNVFHQDFPIPILDNLPLRFQAVAWRPKLPDGDDPRDDRAEGWIDVLSPFRAPGKWQVGHAFSKRGDFPVIFLWHCEIPAHFEMHSHVMSNHCAPLPAIWEKDPKAALLEPGYAAQDALAPLPQVRGEAGDIGRRPTPEIAQRFAAELAAASFHDVFPFLAREHTTTGCVMPMDMEYMHFDGYFGTPITQFAYGKWWYCWNKSWGKSTNNVSVFIPAETSDQKGSVLEPGTPTPTSSHGETWCYMSGSDGKAYKRWHAQLIHHGNVFLNSLSPQIASLPFYHFDPRRYANLGKFTSEKTLPLVPFGSIVHSTEWDRTSFFFGFKLYTAMGWAPEDPLLKEPLKEFYDRCEQEDIPLLNHCTPEGFYTHDRKFYYDLLLGQKMVGDTLSRDQDGWPRCFPRSVRTPDGRILTEPTEERDKIWWFVYNYVSPAAWKPLVQTHKKLKLCLAHFGDSVHLDEKGWDDRKGREPKDTHRMLTIAFSGDQIDRERSHCILADLIDLVQPDNRVFIDLSYVMLNERNSLKFQEVFEWARVHKPILLERILWGTDWPLLGNEPMVTRYNSGPILYRYAMAFRNRLPRMPGDFFLRTCFLNPIQYLGLSGLSQRLSKAGHANIWPWLEDMHPNLFTDFQTDKLELYYRHEKNLVHPLH
jgi:hypothetical protein